jgi:hypothetical protein
MPVSDGARRALAAAAHKGVRPTVDTRRSSDEEAVLVHVTTLDGYHVGSNGEFDRPNVDEELDELSTRQMKRHRQPVSGRVTCERKAQSGALPSLVAGRADAPSLASGRCRNRT